MTTTEAEVTTTPAAAPHAAGMTIADVLARMVPIVPTEAEIETLHRNALAARAERDEAEERRRRMRAEIEAARTGAQPRPELVQVIADLTAQEVEARVKGLTLPSGHAKRMAEARAAVAAAEVKRTEAELLLPALESMLPQINADAVRACDRANHASALYGNALLARQAATRYLPAIAAALQVEAELGSILEEWGGNVSLKVEFRSPETGDRWDRREVERVIERAAAQ